MKGFVIHRPRRIFAARRHFHREAHAPLRRQTLILSVFLFSGIVIGSLSITHLQGSTAVYFSHFIQEYLLSHNTTSIWSVFSESFLSAMMLHCAVFFFGLCCIGPPFVLLFLIGRGMAAGTLSAYLYSNFGLQGLLVNLMIFFLPLLLQLILLLVLCTSALDCSRSLFRANFLGHTVGSAARAQQLLRVFILSSAGVLASACAEALLSALFAPVFF